MLIIRRNKILDLVLSCNSEKIYFLYRYGQMIDNGFDYDKISDKFNEIEQS